jgi:hypothetical protein
MEQEEAIRLAAKFALEQKIKIGEVMHVRKAETCRAHEIWDDKLKVGIFHWRIIFDIPDTTLDPGTAAIGVDDETGRVVFLDNL